MVTKINRLWAVVLGSASFGLSCNVDSTSSNTGGVIDNETAGAGGAVEPRETSEGGSREPGDSEGGAGGAAAIGAGGEPGDAPSPSCPQGVSVVLTDYASTQIALSDLEGTTLSESFISTASTEASGVAFTLSGDVAVPSTRPASGRVVLLDRFGTNVVTWVDPDSAEVLGQLAVGTGFESNPWDYLEVDDRFAWVSRWGHNADPGQQDHDAGGDLLVVDTESYEIVDSMVIEPEEDLPPRPRNLALVGDQVVVALERVSADWATTGEARLAGFSVADRTQTFMLKLAGLKTCESPVPDLDGSRWFVVCTGALSFDGTTESLDQSALVILDFSETPPLEVRRIPAEDIAGEPLQAGVAVAAKDLLLLKTQTAVPGDTNNRWLAYDLETGETTTLAEARPDADGKGQGLKFGGMSCAPGCSSVCLLTDSDRGVLQRVSIEPDGTLKLLDPVEVETSVGLPPVRLGLW